MTTGTFKFQIDQGITETIVITGLSFTHQVKLTQRGFNIFQEDGTIILHEDKIDDMIETLRACKKWLNSP